MGNLLRKDNTGPKGHVKRYDAGDGSFLGDLKKKKNEHHPRGIVFGPDGRLYVANRDLTNGLGGTVLCYSGDGKATFFIDDKGGFGQLNRPDGLVFGPDGRLYITSFRAALGDTDSIRIYSADGQFEGKIDLHNGITEPRVFAQSLLFGPGGKLYVPLASAAVPADSTGEVRRYDVTDATYDVLVSFASGDLDQPVYMTFGNTDPSTLEYVEAERLPQGPWPLVTFQK